MLLPMGLPENVSVIAWGLSLERLLLCYGDIDCLQSLGCISDLLLTVLTCQLVKKFVITFFTMSNQYTNLLIVGIIIHTGSQCCGHNVKLYFNGV